MDGREAPYLTTGDLKGLRVRKDICRATNTVKGGQHRKLQTLFW